MARKIYLQFSNQNFKTMWHGGTDILFLLQDLLREITHFSNF